MSAKEGIEAASASILRTAKSLVGGILSEVGNQIAAGGPFALIGPVGRPSLSSTKAALAEVHAAVGKIPKGAPGKWGSPQRGTTEKAYRLDPAHPRAPAGHPEAGWHINWWDFSTGSRKSGGRQGVVPIQP